MAIPTDADKVNDIHSVAATQYIQVLHKSTLEVSWAVIHCDRRTNVLMGGHSKRMANVR